MDIKQCSKCYKTKALSEYHKDCTQPDGLAYSCKICVKKSRDGQICLSLPDGCKQCKRCLNIKTFNEFEFRSNTTIYKGVCKKCENNRKAEWAKNNSEKIKKSKKSWIENNPDYHSKYNTENKEIISNQKNEWRKNNPKKEKDSRIKRRDKYNEYKKDRMENDPAFKITCYLRNRLRAAIKFDQKAGSAVRDLGCSIEFLKQHFESQFILGMNWENYGKWHIDHIIPLSYFDLTNREQFLIACHYLNLRPLWAEENLIKNDKLPENLEELLLQIKVEVAKSGTINA